MEITDVKIKLVRNKDDRLKAFCLITLDNEFVIRDIKIIMGKNGHFVAMPSRKTSEHCEKCGCKNHLKANFCNECGTSLSKNFSRHRAGPPPKIHADIAHPITSGCRNKIQDAVLVAFEAEVENSSRPGYRPVEFEHDEDQIPEVIS